MLGKTSRVGLPAGQHFRLGAFVRTQPPGSGSFWETVRDGLPAGRPAGGLERFALVKRTSQNPPSVRLEPMQLPCERACARRAMGEGVAAAREAAVAGGPVGPAALTAVPSGNRFRATLGNRLRAAARCSVRPPRHDPGSGSWAKAMPVLSVGLARRRRARRSAPGAPGAASRGGYARLEPGLDRRAASIAAKGALVARDGERPEPRGS